MNSPILVLQEVNKIFKMGHNQVHVLKDIDLTIHQQEVVAMVGPSGAGKTTMLNIAGGLMSPTSGSVKINGQELSDLSDEALAKCRNQLVGFVFQLHHLLPEFTSVENAAMPGIIAGRDRAECYQRAKTLLDEVGLSHRYDHRPGELSGGEQQRVAIARSLLNEPKLLMADEPTGDLDGPTAKEIHALLLSMNKKHGGTLIMVTHNPELADLADRLITVRDGRVE